MFITFEGIEGCGKTTQIKRLARRLEDMDIHVVTTLEPGGTAIGKKTRQILLDATNKHISPLAELFFYAADRAQHVEEVIKPALNKGKWILCDRFYDATTAYQGFARGMDMSLIKLLNETASQGIQPDITFLNDCPVEVGLERAIRRNSEHLQDGQDRFEREKKAFHQAVRKGYLSIAESHKNRVTVIDATLTEDEIENEILGHLSPHLP